MKPALTFLTLLVLLASGTPATARAASLPVRLKQTAYVGGPRVRPLKVIEDSRCPINARCVWAGRVILRVRVIGGRWSRILDLTLGRAEQVADGKLTLVSVTPDRMAGQRLSLGQLRFSFGFEGGL